MEFDREANAMRRFLWKLFWTIYIFWALFWAGIILYVALSGSATSQLQFPSYFALLVAPLAPVVVWRLVGRLIK
jgi:hypothetical protein